MHITYQSENAGSEIQKSPWRDKFWQLIRFTVVTGLIFSGSFFVINFSAYKGIISDFLNPGARAEAEAVLSKGSQGSVDASKLLPVLPDKKQTRKEFAWVEAPIVPTDNRLVIPKLGKSVPLVAMGTENLEGENWSELEKQIQNSLQKGVVHYPGTAKPGQFGNVFLTGHSSYYPWDPGKFKEVFALLGQLEPEDHFYVFYDQKKYTYKVYDKFEVQPNVVDVLAQPKDKKIATLMTCTPVGTTLRRLIIHAEQVS